ncbi:MAG: hypothetical protein NVSMB31_20350 [Vulcanimicrobiaceae bacterium]
MDDTLNAFFAYAPWIGGIAILLAVYFASRKSLHTHGVPIGQTFVCNECGHRANREHMVPVAREGSVMWYCPRHAH